MANRPINGDIVGKKRLQDSLEPPKKELPPPDGGWGWVIVFASFIIHIIVDGVVYTFGIFYVEFLNHYHQSKAKTSWILSILTGVMLALGPVSSALTNKYGCRGVTIYGGILAAIGLTLSTFAPTVEVLYVTVGLLTGAGFGLIYVPAIISVSMYFEKKRAFATGIAVCGSGVGTFAMAPFLQILVDYFAWKGALLITAGIVLNCIAFGALFRPLSGTSAPKNMKPMKRRSSCSSEFTNGDISNRAHNPDLVKRQSMVDINSVKLTTNKTGNPDYSKKRALSKLMECVNETGTVFSEMLDLSIMKNPVYILFLISNFLTSIGFNVPFVYTKDRAIHEGISDSEEGASFLLSVIGISNMVGRIVIGYLSDQSCVNRVYLYNALLTICGFGTAFSFICDGYLLMAAYCSIFGITAGAYIGLTSVILADLFGLAKLTNAFGILLLFQGAAGFIGPPIAGWLFDATQSYDAGYAVAGTCIAFSGIMLFAIPLLKRCEKRPETVQVPEIVPLEKVTVKVV